METLLWVPLTVGSLGRTQDMIHATWLHVQVAPAVLQCFSTHNPIKCSRLWSRAFGSGFLWSFFFFFCWEIGQKLLLWHRLSRSMNEGIRSDVSPTWQRERRVHLIRSRFNFINVRINSAHGCDTGREAGGGSRTCPTTFGVRGRVKRDTK